MCGGIRLVPPAGSFLSSAKERNQRTPPKPRFWIPKRAPHIGKLFWCVPHVWKILQGALNVGAETILNLGHVLLKPYLPTGKEVKKPSGFLRIFGYFLCAQKAPRRRHGHADSATDPVKTQKKPPQQKCCGGWHPMQCIGLCPARPCKPSYNLHRVQQVGCLQHASPLPTSSRIRQPGGLRSTH